MQQSMTAIPRHSLGHNGERATQCHQQTMSQFRKGIQFLFPSKSSQKYVMLCYSMSIHQRNKRRLKLQGDKGRLLSAISQLGSWKVLHCNQLLGCSFSYWHSPQWLAGLLLLVWRAAFEGM